MATRRTSPRPSPRQRVRDAARELGMRNVGGGADWINDAYHLGPSARPNQTSGDLYLIADEDNDARFHLVRRYYLSDDSDYPGAPADLVRSRRDLFDGYNDVVWFEREDLTASQAIQALQRGR